MIEAKAVNHLGIAVRSIADHKQFYVDVLGAEYEAEEVVEEQKVKVGFFKVGDVRLELLEPTSEDSPISAFLEKRGEGLHHVAYTVSGLEDRLAALKAGGVRLIDETPRNGAHHTKIAFLHPKASCGVLTELCEPKGD
ncbi:methylmalonyl-CoA epimerase [Mucisphaera calidilacus]|uniref:Glyoxalase/Bleomycin resistance protein/Dioxygenase superfamily protein n=1 Tax=Mucisphaera calidilacus TaxID=2527982 RepID=A0A518C0P6_9BACT|nr:methylmalonyl-CoA epimerase [Mucisphaera calidilacus]QDU72791.1 Glyoxalase/Bleomycin resistance protein/Dioxygenase superfamily protein [Mucisphaera calidilacus]